MQPADIMVIICVVGFLAGFAVSRIRKLYLDRKYKRPPGCNCSGCDAPCGRK